MTKTLCGSVAVVFALALALAMSGRAAAATADLGPNVIVIDPSMPTSQIQTTVDAIASQQITIQFGTQRYALLFKPGTYGSGNDPLNFQVGYYTSIAGLGRSPGDVVINGSVYVHNQCDGSFCTALNNFWRSLSNLTINVDTHGKETVFAPSVQMNSSGTSWAGGATPGTSIPINRFYVAKPSDSAATINAALGTGRNLVLTPGVYHLDQSITVRRPDTVVLGLGFPTLIPTNGNAAMTTARAKGILITGVLVEAGPMTTPSMLQDGSCHVRSDDEAA